MTDERARVLEILRAEPNGTALVDALRHLPLADQEFVAACLAAAHTTAAAANALEAAWRDE